MSEKIDVTDPSQFNPQSGEMWAHNQTGREVEITFYIAGKVGFQHPHSGKSDTLDRSTFALQYTYCRKSL